VGKLLISLDILSCMSGKLTQSEAGKLGYEISKEKLKQSQQDRFAARKKEYYKNPKLCKCCSTIIPYDKKQNNFCNIKCSTKFNKKSENEIIPRVNCLNCNVLNDTGIKYCSLICQQAYQWNLRKEQIISDGYDSSCNHKMARKYLIELSEGKCQICGLNEWQGKPMPLVLDHIDGNSTDGSLTNLRIICNNCDALTDTYKGKNRGKGRYSRSKRYRDGKSY
jgi:hypothetical protein